MNTEEELDIYHVIDGMVCKLHLTIDRGIIATIGFDDYLILKADMYEVRRVGNLYSFISS